MIVFPLLEWVPNYLHQQNTREEIEVKNWNLSIWMVAQGIH